VLAFVATLIVNIAIPIILDTSAVLDNHKGCPYDFTKQTCSVLATNGDEI
jgi:hypothetical protein